MNRLRDGDPHTFTVFAFDMEHGVAWVAGDVARHDIHDPTVRDDQHAVTPVACAYVFDGCDHTVGKLIHGFAADKFGRRVAAQNLFQ